MKARQPRFCGVRFVDEDKATNPIIFRPEPSAYFLRAISNREKSGGVIHRASTQSHAGDPVRDVS